MPHFIANIFFFQNKTTEFSKNFETIRELIAEYGDCLSFDYFKPVKNEREAEKLALSETSNGFPPIASKYKENGGFSLYSIRTSTDGQTHRQYFRLCQLTGILECRFFITHNIAVF